MQLLIIKRRGAGSQFLLSNYPATAHMPGMGAKAGAPHAPIPNGGDVGMPKADEYNQKQRPAAGCEALPDSNERKQFSF